MKMDINNALHSLSSREQEVCNFLDTTHMFNSVVYHHVECYRIFFESGGCIFCLWTLAYDRYIVMSTNFFAFEGPRNAIWTRWEETSFQSRGITSPSLTPIIKSARAVLNLFFMKSSPVALFLDQLCPQRAGYIFESPFYPECL